ncbi:MAG: serine/threonine-protein kinase, partial [Actinomycetes bacterium]
MRFGDFEVLETAGAGATGTVYRARDVRSGKVVAVKVVSPDAVAGLEQEAATLRRLQHRHLVRLLETGTTEDGRPWLAQAWVDGVGLDRLLQVHGTLTAEQAVGVLHGALQGLAHAHEQGVVHRDVAPGNVLVDTAGTSMLVGFGIAAPVGATGVRGTPAFLSPEAAAGAAVGPTSDVYSAGAVLHLLLAGQPVFPVADVTAALQAHRTTAPPRLHGHGEGFADLLQRCLAKSPADRPPDAGALLSELDDTADRRFGAGWLARASVAALVPAARAAGSGTAGTQAAGAARETVVLTTGAVSTGAAAAAAPAPAASTA